MKLYKNEIVDLTSLTEYQSNSRTHSPEQVAQIVASIAEFGFTNPLLVDDNNCIRAGHARAEAAGISGMKQVPIIRLTGLDEQQLAALVIADFFGGSGSTLIACEKINRQAFLMELDEKYCDVIIKRWQDFTGKQAINIQSGKAYNDV
jgi:ParB-like chromosome segregation protein Spo0J